MVEPTSHGQAEAMRYIARAARALTEDGEIDVAPLLPAYRVLRPAGHSGAGADVVDVEFLARCRSLGGDALLATRTIVATAGRWRSAPKIAVHDDGAHLIAPPGPHTAGDALALALGLALEAAKLAHGLPATPDALRAAFPTPTAARAALDALAAGGAARTVRMARRSPRVDEGALSALVSDRPVYVACAAAGARMHDLLSPFGRRLRPRLSQLGKHTSAAGDDDIYAGIDTLFLSDEHAIDERATVEERDGLIPVGRGAVAITCEAIADGEVDRRCRDAVQQLKRSRALIVVVEGDADSLAAVLRAAGGAPRVVTIVVEGSRDATPAALVDVASGHVVSLDNALSASGLSTSIPSLGLAPPDDDDVRDTALFALAQPVIAARARALVPPTTRLAVKIVPVGDVQSISRVCLEILQRIGAPPQRNTRSKAR